jgi:hypothetical protein
MYKDTEDKSDYLFFNKTSKTDLIFVYLFILFMIFISIQLIKTEIKELRRNKNNQIINTDNDKELFEF